MFLQAINEHLIRSLSNILTSVCACTGFAAQAGATGQGALGSLARSAQSFAPELAQDIENIL